eukprot:gene11461-15353_t
MSLQKLSRNKSVMHIEANPFEAALSGSGSPASSLHVESLSDAKPLDKQQLQNLIKKLNDARELPYDRFVFCFFVHSDNETRLNILESDKIGVLFSSEDLCQLLEVTTSVKTRLNMISMIGPRLVDPRAKMEQLMGLFRFVEEKSIVEEVLRARVQTLSAALFKTVDSSNALGGRGGKGGRGGRGMSRPTSTLEMGSNRLAPVSETSLKSKSLDRINEVEDVDANLTENAITRKVRFPNVSNGESNQTKDKDDESDRSGGSGTSNESLKSDVEVVSFPMSSHSYAMPNGQVKFNVSATSNPLSRTSAASSRDTSPGGSSTNSSSMMAKMKNQNRVRQVLDEPKKDDKPTIVEDEATVASRNNFNKLKSTFSRPPSGNPPIAPSVPHNRSNGRIVSERFKGGFNRSNIDDDTMSLPPPRSQPFAHIRRNSSEHNTIGGILDSSTNNSTTAIPLSTASSDAANKCAAVLNMDKLTFLSLAPEGPIGSTTVSVLTSEGETVNEVIEFYSYQELVRRNFSKEYHDLHQNELQKYLNDKEFEEIFKKSKDQFQKQPRWKQIDQKKNALLF